MTSLKKTARIAGLWYLTFALGPFYLLYVPSKTIVRNDAAATSALITSHEKLFRFGLLAETLGAVVFIGLALALYRLFEDVDRTAPARWLGWFWSQPRSSSLASSSMRPRSSRRQPSLGWHEPDESRGSRPDLWEARGEIPRAYPATGNRAMPNRTEARPAKAVLTNATGRLQLLRLFSTPLIFPGLGI
jgi:hypothetical protein